TLLALCSARTPRHLPSFPTRRSSDLTKAARAALNDLVDSLGPWSELLVDAFGVPSEITSVNLMQRYEDMVTKAESDPAVGQPGRSEEHTSELQSRFDLVCRLLLEKKK